MISWVSLAVALLKWANSLLSWAHERELISQGHEEAMAEEAKKILSMTKEGKRLSEKLNALDDKDRNSLIDDLGRWSGEGGKN